MSQIDNNLSINLHFFMFLKIEPSLTLWRLSAYHRLIFIDMLNSIRAGVRHPNISINSLWV